MSKEKKIKKILEQKNIDKEYDGTYSKIVRGIAGTRFDAYYIKGESVKLTDGVLVLTVHKPGRCSTSGGYYKNEVIELTAGGRSQMTYSDFMSLSRAVEQAIDMLNSEKRNVIDRATHKEGYSTTRKRKAIVKKPRHALSQEEVEVGGIYLDDKQNAYVYLGEDLDLDYIAGPMLEIKNNIKLDIPADKIEFSDMKFDGKISLSHEIPSNQISFNKAKIDGIKMNESFRIGYDDAHFAYLYYTDELKVDGSVITTGNNMVDNLIRPKKFYGKIGQLELGVYPLIIHCGKNTYTLSPRVKVKDTSQEQSL